MTKAKHMTQKELDQISGGPHIRNYDGKPAVMGKQASRTIIVPDFKVGGQYCPSDSPPHHPPAFGNARIGVPPEPK